MPRGEGSAQRNSGENRQEGGALEPYKLQKNRGKVGGRQVGSVVRRGGAATERAAELKVAGNATNVWFMNRGGWQSAAGCG